MNREDVIARLKAAEPELKARGVAHLHLYGSYALDEAREDSDIDILIDFETANDIELYAYMAPYIFLENQFPGKEIGYSTREGLVSHYRPYIEQSVIRVF